MGTGASSRKNSPKKSTYEEANIKLMSQVNKKIEKELAESLILNKKTIKLLLIGGAESGKSTIAKQIKILHLNGFSDTELKHYSFLVHTNVITAMLQLIAGLEILAIDSSRDNIVEEIETVRRFVESTRSTTSSIDTETARTVSVLWSSSSVQTCYERRAEIDLLESAKYFLDDVDRVTNPSYVPTPQDIVRSRTATVGIHEIEFTYKDHIFKLVDVGGQKTERRKWIHCFDNVTAVLFVVALSEYDLSLSEDRTKNRMLDSIELFNSITNSTFLMKSSTLLFLNKTDVFIDKIKRVSIKVCFPGYTGANDYESTKEFILKQFLRNKPPSKVTFHHFTNATDTQNIEVVFGASVSTILARNMSTVGIS